MADIKPFWYFVGGLCLLYIFALLVKPTGGFRPYPGPGPAPYGPAGHLIGPGGQRRLVYTAEGFVGNQAEFKMFGVDWCGYCKKAKPEFESLGATTTIGGTPVLFQYVNPEQDRASAAGFQLDGYPTFYLVQGGQKTKYDGPRTKSGFLQFLQEKLGGSA